MLTCYRLPDYSRLNIYTSTRISCCLGLLIPCQVYRPDDLFLASSRLLPCGGKTADYANSDSGMMVFGQVNDAALLYAQPGAPVGPYHKLSRDTADLTLETPGAPVSLPGSP